MSIADIILKIAVDVVVLLVLGLPITILAVKEGRRYFSTFTYKYYTICQPRYFFWLIIGILIILTVFVLFMFFLNESFGDPGSIFFGGFLLFYIIFAVYLLKWKIVVDRDEITVYHPFRKIFKTTFNDITYAKQEFERITVYVDNKRAFSIYNYMMGFKVFSSQLYKFGKTEATQFKRDGFVVTRDRTILWVGVFGALLFGGFLVWTILGSDETVDAFVCIGFSTFIVFNLLLIIYSARWRIEFEYNTVYFHPTFGRKMEFSTKDIKKVEVKGSCISLYMGDKKKIKVEKGYKGFPILLERLKNEKIPFTTRKH